MNSLAIRLAALAVALTTVNMGLAEDWARIFVYARRDTPAKSWLSVSCGNAAVAELKQGTFFAIRVEPGRYTLLVGKGVPLSIDLAAGEPAFVRLDWSYGVDRDPIPSFSKVRPAEAGLEMKYLSYVDARRIHSSLVPGTDPRGTFQPQLRTR